MQEGTCRGDCETQIDCVNGSKEAAVTALAGGKSPQRASKRCIIDIAVLALHLSVTLNKFSIHGRL